MSVVFTASTRSPIRSLPGDRGDHDHDNLDADVEVEEGGEDGSPVAAAAPPGMILLM